MKISPVAGTPSQSLGDNFSFSQSKLDRAKAIAGGQDPEEQQPSNDAPNRIKMRTQVSPDREVTRSDTLDTGKSVEAANEETKQLDPNAVALAKQKRALQRERQELLAMKKDLESKPDGTKSLEDYRSRLKSEALKVLQEEGVTYDQLTEQILATNQNDPDIAALKNEIKSLKEGFENQNKQLTEREANARKQAIDLVTKDVVSLINTGDDFDLIRAENRTQDVVNLITKVFDETGDYLDERKAAQMIQDELVEETLNRSKLKSVQGRLAGSSQKTQPATTGGQPRTMKTLTNRDGSSSMPLSRRERAILAWKGELK